MATERSRYFPNHLVTICLRFWKPHRSASCSAAQRHQKYVTYLCQSSFYHC